VVTYRQLEAELRKYEAEAEAEEDDQYVRLLEEDDVPPVDLVCVLLAGVSWCS
jgi:hypothetical protein